MRRWTARGLHSVAWRRQYLPVRPALYQQVRGLHSNPTLCGAAQEKRFQTRPVRFATSRNYDVFKDLSPPERTPEAWTGLLEGALPPHLRDLNIEPPILTLGAVHVAEILLAAQYPEDPADGGLDLLFHLGFHQGRWNAVVWLIKKLIDKFPVRHAQNSRLAQLAPIWNGLPDLDAATQYVINFDEEGATPFGVTESRSLDDLTASVSSTHESAAGHIGHDALGQIWRTLGAMTRACVGDEIKPEILEIIAYLHHREVMPMAIYQAEPHSDTSAIQQPPLLSFLSSRILTSLSDAAWRAHERLVVEESKANGSEFAALRPELPGTAYRVHVAGLRTEVWMELILWSCLYGGWIHQGCEVLQSLVEGGWRSLSWKQYERRHSSQLSTEPREWNTWEYIFKTRAKSTMDAPKEAGPSLERVVSAELVNAYIDAIVTSVYVGVDSSGIAMHDVLSALFSFKAFLYKGHQKDRRLGLNFGTWESLIVRLLETQAVVPESDSGLLQELTSISTRFGQRLQATNAQGLPAYTLDGTLAVQGFLHRALRGQITSGSFEGALEVFSLIQKRADADRQKSVLSFFIFSRKYERNPREPPEAQAEARARRSLFSVLSNSDDMFTSNMSGVEYPAFNVQIPSTTLGSFLDLALDNREFDFGRWLLYNDDADGPIISEAMYNDPHVQPAVIRFAAETEDEKLLIRLKDTDMQRTSLRALLNFQFSTMRWDSAVRVLGHLKPPGPRWEPYNLANLASVMCSLRKSTAGGDRGSGENLRRAERIFQAMLHMHFEGRGMEATRINQVQSVLTVLTAIDPYWTNICADLQLIQGYHHQLVISARTFNTLLKAVVNVHGSAAGRRLLDTFWPHSARRAHDAAFRLSRDKARRLLVAQSRPRALESIKRVRIVVRQKSRLHDQLVAYGAVTPDVNTILIILRKALKEVQDQPHDGNSGLPTDEVVGNVYLDPGFTQSSRELVAWAVRHLAELPYVGGSIITQLDSFLAEHGMEDLRKELPELYRVVETEVFDDAQLESETNEDRTDVVEEEDIQDALSVV